MGIPEGPETEEVDLKATQLDNFTPMREACGLLAKAPDAMEKLPTIFKDMEPLVRAGRAVCVGNVPATALTCKVESLVTNVVPALAGRIVFRSEGEGYGGLFGAGNRHLTTSAWTDQEIGPRGYGYADPEDALDKEGCYLTVWLTTVIDKKGQALKADGAQGRK